MTEEMFLLDASSLYASIFQSSAIIILISPGFLPLFWSIFEVSSMPWLMSVDGAALLSPLSAPPSLFIICSLTSGQRSVATSVSCPSRCQNSSAMCGITGAIISVTASRNSRSTMRVAAAALEVALHLGNGIVVYVGVCALYAQVAPCHSVACFIFEFSFEYSQ